MVSLSRGTFVQKQLSPSRDPTLETYRYETAFANLALTCTSAWALVITSNSTSNCRHRRIREVPLDLLSHTIVSVSLSSVTFFLHFIHSLVGVVRYGNPRYGGNVRRLYHFTTLLTVTVGIPFYAAQFALSYKVPVKIVNTILFLSISVATWHLLRARWVSNPKKMVSEFEWAQSVSVRVAVIVNLALILFLSYEYLNYYGFTSSITFSICFFITGVTGTTIFNIPAVDFYIYQVSFFNIYSALALKD